LFQICLDIHMTFITLSFHFLKQGDFQWIFLFFIYLIKSIHNFDTNIANFCEDFYLAYQGFLHIWKLDIYIEYICVYFTFHE